MEIKDLDGLKAAIREAGRHEHAGEQRTAAIKAAAELGYADVIPDSWDPAGGVERAWAPERRETANDVFSALNSALNDQLEEQQDDDRYWYVWVQDWDAGEDGGYRVIYCLNCDLFAAPFSWTEDNRVVVDLAAATKVRQITTFVDRKRTATLEWRRKKVEQLRGLERRDFDASGLEIRDSDADEGTWTLTGYASVTNQSYDVGFYAETIRAGAFKRTLSESPDVQLLINHEGLPLARTRSSTLRLEERARGLFVEADLDKQDPDAQRLHRKMARGDIDQMSFAFQVTDQEWSEDYSQRTIKSVSIHRGDVSVVNQGANEASTASIRSTEALQALRRAGIHGVHDALMEVRAGKALSAATTEVLTRVLELVASADDAVDEAQPLLADLMGVPNPDEDDSDEGSAERSLPVVVIPDRTTERRQRLAALRRASR